MDIIRKDIDGYEDIYQVSNTGLVKSLDRIIQLKNGRFRKRKGQILVGSPTDGSVVLCCNGDLKRCMVGHLVALAFIRKVQPGEIIAHIDGDYFNNKVENLSIRNLYERNSKGMKFVMHEHNNTIFKSKPVNQYSIDGSYLRSFESLSKAGLSFGKKNANCNIFRNIKGLNKHAYGYIRKYADTSTSISTS